MSGTAEFWLFLSTSPLFWLALTLGAYVGADALAARTSRHPAANPVLLTIGGVGAVLIATGTDHQTYFAGAQFINVLLGPATVAFAVPILRHRSAIRRNLPAIVVTLAAGTSTGVVSAVLLAKLFGGGPALVASVAPKSVTAPIAMGVSREVGGLPELTAVVVIATGVAGAILVTPLMDALRVRDCGGRGVSPRAWRRTA